MKVSTLSKLFAVLFLASLVLAACAPAPQSGAPAMQSVTPASPQPTQAAPTVETPAAPAVTPTPAGTQNIPAAEAAVNDLAKRLNIPAAQVKITQVQNMEWTDSCLGLGGPAESCLQVITPGFLVMLEANGQVYEYHTNESGSILRSKPEATGGAQSPAQPGDLMPAAVEIARQTLAQQLQVKADAVEVVQFDAVDWPNGCLGIDEPGRMCTQVITPGYRVILAVDGKQYEFHTDMGGGAVEQALSPLPATTEKVITWEGTLANTCRRVEISAANVAFGECGGTMTEAPLSEARLGELRELLGVYASFSGDTTNGKVSLTGQGTQMPTPAEQRAVAAWADLIGQEAEAGRSGAAWGVVLNYSRTGGIAGFCDDLVVYQSGWVIPASCKDASGAELKPFRLSATQLDQLYRWVDAYQRFDLSEKTPPGASDAMTVTLGFEGQGSQTVPANIQAEIAAFAAQVLAQKPQ